jgi:hypothetical protein
MRDVECPVDNDCDYSGTPSSVEAHISSSTDDTHAGEVGRYYHDELHGESDIENNSAEITDNEQPDIVDESDQTDQSEPTSKQRSVSPGKALVGATLVFALVTVVFPSGVSTADNQTTPDRDSDSNSDLAEDTVGGLIQ